MGQLEKQKLATEKVMEELEKLNSEKDVFYDNLPIRFIDLCEDMEFINSPASEIPSKEVEEVNMLFR